MNVPSYVEHRAAGLEQWAECVWERSAGARPDVARVIPDGCMDVVFSQARGLSVVGPNTTAFLASVPAHSSALGVRMHPGCGPPLFGVEAESLRDGGSRPPSFGVTPAGAWRTSLRSRVGPAPREP